MPTADQQQLDLELSPPTPVCSLRSLSPVPAAQQRCIYVPLSTEQAELYARELKLRRHNQLQPHSRSLSDLPALSLPNPPPPLSRSLFHSDNSLLSNKVRDTSVPSESLLWDEPETNEPLNTVPTRTANRSWSSSRTHHSSMSNPYPSALSSPRTDRTSSPPPQKKTIVPLATPSPSPPSPRKKISRKSDLTPMDEDARVKIEKRLFEDDGLEKKSVKKSRKSEENLSNDSTKEKKISNLPDGYWNDAVVKSEQRAVKTSAVSREFSSDRTAVKSEDNPVKKSRKSQRDLSNELTVVKSEQTIEVNLADPSAKKGVISTLKISRGRSASADIDLALSKNRSNSIIDAITIVLPCLKSYRILPVSSIGESESTSDSQCRSITLEYAGLNSRECFPIVRLTRRGHLDYDPLLDLRTSATHLVDSLPPSDELLGSTKRGPLRSVIRESNFLRQGVKEDASELVAAVEKLNEGIRKLRGEKGVKDMGDEGCAEFVSHVLEQSYARSVAPVSEMLNHYKGFSNNVYGEVKQALVTDFIRNTHLRSKHVFLDMGSGIGNVVLQVAGQVLCESHGVEIMEIPAKLAQKQADEFLARMKAYGRKCGSIGLLWADFLESKEIDEILKRADVIFVNNYAFDADLNQKILQKFLDVKEGARIISLKSFLSTGRINMRNINSIESILTVKEYYFGKDSVSWMNESGKYFIHTVSRTMRRRLE
ncbi:histone methylation protein DOT1-domain-containing protein [Cladochytrium replicatum]|nr:histone methylation protein DOT1-domain-containing protein [Cladochytrium replicatum]